MRMRRYLGLLFALFVLLACGQPETTTPSSTREDGVEVIVIATPVLTEAGIELCPAGLDSKCPGIILEGELTPELFEPEGQYPAVITIQGYYDGARLVPTVAAERLSSSSAFGPTEIARSVPG